ncbi:hypothetical protein [Stenotrophomonas sp. GZD-301]|uniref:hypothetical protein n=1 Tax=Stenotrophomonas sp. GZD-301 TaxID=3404814 RepID=UPI003BB7A7DD
MTDSEYSLDVLHAKLAAAEESGQWLLLSSLEVARALNAFLAGEITKEEIADWAEFHDANDGVAFETNEAIPAVIFAISSPEINGWLDNARARQLLSDLHALRSP